MGNNISRRSLLAVPRRTVRNCHFLHKSCLINLDKKLNFLRWKFPNSAWASHAYFLHPRNCTRVKNSYSMGVFGGQIRAPLRNIVFFSEQNPEKFHEDFSRKKMFPTMKPVFYHRFVFIIIILYYWKIKAEIVMSPGGASFLKSSTHAKGRLLVTLVFK